MSSPRIFICTVVALLGFAGNSLLCRLALKQSAIDAATFTTVRIVSGALILWSITRLGKSRSAQPALSDAASWFSAVALFVYAAAFSFAYVSLPAGTGALLLFGAVQATMVVSGWWEGERLGAVPLSGFFLALAGLIVLLLPGLAAPSLVGSLLMLIAGVAWGVYSLRGRGGGNPALVTAGNFLRAVPLAIILSLSLFPLMGRLDWRGLTLAVISGSLTSGLGYIVWYLVLPFLKTTSAAIVQLSVPILTATGGILLLHEPVTFRYFIATIAVLGGIALVVLQKSRAA